ncbi:MAG: hypothetical protein KF805_04780 [Phycisphaeraceae bacterium]|nr:hypothetical protein [Phycisphaeraceae bacterium]
MLRSISFSAKVLAATFMALGAIGCESPPRVTDADIDRLTGPQWNGTLTYRDYTTNKNTTIESTLLVVKAPSGTKGTNESAGETSGWEFRFGYPHEPKVDFSKLITLSSDGSRLGDETVTRRASLPGGTLRIVTEKHGTDNDKPAQFQFHYNITPTRLTMTKLVKPDGSSEFFERNEYQWSR